MVDDNVYDTGNDLSIMTTETFAAQRKHAVAKVFWQAQTSNIAIVNQLRAMAGLPSTMHDANGAVAERVLRLVTDEDEPTASELQWACEDHRRNDTAAALKADPALLLLERDQQTVYAARPHSALDLHRGHGLKHSALRAMLVEHLLELLAGHLAPDKSFSQFPTLYCGIPVPFNDGETDQTP